MKGIYLSLCNQKKTVIVTKVSHLQARTSFQLTVQITKESTFLAPSFCPSDFVYKEKWVFQKSHGTLYLPLFLHLPCTCGSRKPNTVCFLTQSPAVITLNYLLLSAN